MSNVRTCKTCGRQNRIPADQSRWAECSGIAVKSLHLRRGALRHCDSCLNVLQVLD